MQRYWTYISGGARSGKSRYAMERARALSERPLYLATARRWDADFEKRIEQHQADRDAHWESLEAELYPSRLPLSGRVVVLDCLTLWLTNLFSDHQSEVDAALDAFKIEIDRLRTIDATLFIVSNELGMGLHPHTEVGRHFTDLQGWANQYVAKLAEEAFFMISGMPLRIK